MLRELEWALHDRSCRCSKSFRLFLGAEHLAVELFERRLVIVGIHRACASSHEKLDDALHLRGMMRDAGGNRIAGEHLGQGESGETAAEFPKELPPSKV